MAVALLGKCIGLLGLVVLLYATCYGFRIRDVAPGQTHSGFCVSAHGRTCPDKTATTTTTTAATTSGGPMHLARKWHESAVSRTAGGRRPPAEPTSDDETERPRIERPAEYSRDKGATRPRGFRVETVEVDDDKEEEEALVEVEDGEEEEAEDDGSVGDSEGDRTDEEDDDDEEKTSGAELSDEDIEHEKKGPGLKGEPDSDDDDEVGEGDDDDEDEDDNDDKGVGKKIFGKDTKKQVEGIKRQITTAKTVKSMRYGSKNKAVDDNDDDDDNDDEDDAEDKDDGEKKKEKIVAKTDKRKDLEPVKKQVSPLRKKPDQSKLPALQRSDDDDKGDDSEEDKETNTREGSTSAPRKLEKVRLADKDKAKAAKIVPDKLVAEKPRREEEGKPAEKPAKPKVAGVKKTNEGTRKPESTEDTKKPVEAVQRTAEKSAKKSPEGAKKTESVKAVAPESKTEVPGAKVAERSKKTSAQPESSTPAPKIKEPARQPQKKNVKKAAAATPPTLRPSREVSRAKSEYCVKIGSVRKAGFGADEDV